MWNKSLKKFRSERDTSNTSAVLCQLSYQANWELVIQTSNLMVSYPFTALLITCRIVYAYMMCSVRHESERALIKTRPKLYHKFTDAISSYPTPKWQPLTTSEHINQSSMLHDIITIHCHCHECFQQQIS